MKRVQLVYRCLRCGWKGTDIEREPRVYREGFEWIVWHECGEKQYGHVEEIGWNEE